MTNTTHWQLGLVLITLLAALITLLAALMLVLAAGQDAGGSEGSGENGLAGDCWRDEVVYASAELASVGQGSGTLEGTIGSNPFSVLSHALIVFGAVVGGTVVDIVDAIVPRVDVGPVEERTVSERAEYLWCCPGSVDYLPLSHSASFRSNLLVL